MYPEWVLHKMSEEGRSLEECLVEKLAAEKLAEHVADFGVAAEVVSDVEAAVHRAKELADGYDVILFAGSLYLIGDVRRLWRNERGEER